MEVTTEMKKLLGRLADLAAQTSDEVYDDGKEDGTAGILKLCDQLADKIYGYLIETDETRVSLRRRRKFYELCNRQR